MTYYEFILWEYASGVLPPAYPVPARPSFAHQEVKETIPQLEEGMG